MKLDFEELALAHLGDALMPQAVQGMLDGLALGIEHRSLERNVDASLHGYVSYCRGSRSDGLRYGWFFLAGLVVLERSRSGACGHTSAVCDRPAVGPRTRLDPPGWKT